MWKWIIGGSALILVGGGLFAASELKSLDALTAVPSNAPLVVEVNLADLADDFESERFTSTFGKVNDIWKSAEVETTRDPAETAASIAGWAGPSLAIWSSLEGSGNLEEPSYCIDFSVIRKSAADAEIQKYLKDEAWDATERQLDQGTVWETTNHQYIGRIGRIVFICEGPGDLVEDIVRALGGDSILTVEAYESTLATVNPGSVSVWIDVPTLLGKTLEAGEIGLTETTEKLVQKLGPAVLTLDISDKAIALRAFVSATDPNFLGTVLPTQDRSSELPENTMVAVFTALSQQAIDLVDAQIPDEPSNNSFFGLDADLIVQLLDTFRGDLTMALFEGEEGGISAFSGIPLDAQVLVGAQDPTVTMDRLNQLIASFGLGGFLSFDTVDGTPVAKAGFGGADLVAWAARSDVFVIGADANAATMVGPSLDEAKIFNLAKEAQTPGMSTSLFVDVQRSIEFITTNDIGSQEDVREIQGLDQVTAIIAGAQIVEGGVSMEWLFVIDW